MIVLIKAVAGIQVWKPFTLKHQ